LDHAPADSKRPVETIKDNRWPQNAQVRNKKYHYGFSVGVLSVAKPASVQARQPPVGTRRGSSQHRLKLIYMAQIGERPPRFAIQVNSRARVTRDYAYFLENRLRARYGMDGVPLVIDFVERGQRGRGDGRAAAGGEPRNGARSAGSAR